MDWRGVMLLVGFGIAGALVGWAYFALMRRSVESMTAGKTGKGRFALTAGVRLALFCGGAAGALWAGGWSIAAYVAGFLAARTVAVSRARNEGAVLTAAGSDAAKSGEGRHE